jgi:hypothetical protein
MTTTSKLAAALAAALTITPVAYAQQGGMRGMNTMPGGAMPGMNMQSMMNQCTQMRRQMRPGAAVPANMQQMVAQCDQMDRQSGNMPGMGAQQAPVGTRSR